MKWSSKLLRILLITAGSAAVVALAPCPLEAAAADVSFSQQVSPFVVQHCLRCHNQSLSTAGINFAPFEDEGALGKPMVWEKALRRLRSGEMPPPGQPQPSGEENTAVAGWIEKWLERQPRSGVSSRPGRVTLRRLNRAEYDNTIRDLVGVDFQPADDFPADDSGYGFDTIGDILTLSPLLMEKYLAAAAKIEGAALADSEIPQPRVKSYLRDRLEKGARASAPRAAPALALNGAMVFRNRFPADGRYRFKINAGQQGIVGAQFMRLGLWIDGQSQEFEHVFHVREGANEPRVFELELRVGAGSHVVGAVVLEQRVESKNIANGPGEPAIEAAEISGPFDAAPTPPSESRKKLLTCGHLDGNHVTECARVILSTLARRAYRRAVSDLEVDRYVKLAQQAELRGEPFEKALGLALRAILVSPHFLFRVEREAIPEDNSSAYLLCGAPHNPIVCGAHYYAESAASDIGSPPKTPSSALHNC